MSDSGHRTAYGESAAITSRVDGEALRLSEQRYRALVEASNQVVWSWSPDGPNQDLGRIRQWWESLTGHTAAEQEASPTAWLDVVHPDDRTFAGKAWNTALARCSKCDFECRVRARDGGWRHVQARGVPICNPDGSVREWIGTFNEVTDSRRIESELRDIRARMEAALAAGAIGTWTWEVPTDRFFADQSLAQIFGLAPEHVHGVPLAQIVSSIHPDDQPRVAEHIARALASGDHYEADYRVVQSDGSWRWITARGQVERDAEGRARRLPGVVIDITDRKNAEESLRHFTDVSERRRRLYETALSNTLDLVYVFDLEHRFTYANEALLKMWGKTWEDSIGRTCLELGYEPWHAAMHEQEIDRVVATRQSIRGEVPFTGTNGRRIYEYIFVPVIGADGAVEAVAGTTRDVSDRQQAEERQKLLLRAVEAERTTLADVFQHAPSFMCVLRGPDHIFERANDRYLDLLARQDIIGKPVREAIPELEGQGFFEILDRVYGTGEPFIGSAMRVTLLRGEQLEEKILEFVYQPMRNLTGEVAGILVHGIDLTERANAENRLVRLTAETERQRRVYETALSNNPDFNYVFDLQGRFTFVNRALLALWQKDLTEAVGKTFFELDYPPDLAARLHRQIQEVIETKLPLRDETPYTSQVGTRAYEYIFVPVFGSDGSVEAVVGSTRDITERKQSEQALREADRKKDDFIALLAHELRNPLAPIRNGLQVIRLSDDRGARDQAQEMMNRQLSHMVRLIDDLMDVSRISRNKMDLRRSRLALADVIHSAIETAGPSIEEADHELTVSLPSKPIHLDADLTRLSQVFSNLLNNSAKYTEKSGRIWLSAERQDKEVAVSIRDTGIGIPPEALDRIFDMFSQVDRSIERNTGGLGIGLALVKGLVEMHGGTVTASSEGLGKGSTFTVLLPILEDHKPTSSRLPDYAGGISGANRRMLVVDDNKDGAESLAIMLRLLGNEVRTANDGVEAVELAEQFRPEIILMDVGMPKLNGLDATRQIREYAWGRDMTIIALTGWGQDNDREESREAGCDGHLVKPVNLPDLERVLGKK